MFAFDSSNALAAYVPSFTAFYADCKHEIQPLTSGYRIALVYNLINTNPHLHLVTPGVRI